ncbi:hypothetical protein FB567DRAFT_314619 [Paraphoma chrysanthemicola]|uniref:Uncharacterized protein n=1 Tax=Paraphoma chrysanthemicola TaxID=798071 RepID=A0A8K0RCD7_9PLEO|nr:hypothetical protein FB567DRAFT_314619 [Paraphoma chrysanthemicola]
MISLLAEPCFHSSAASHKPATLLSLHTSFHSELSAINKTYQACLRRYIRAYLQSTTTTVTVWSITAWAISRASTVRLQQSASTYPPVSAATSTFPELQQRAESQDIVPHTNGYHGDHYPGMEATSNIDPALYYSNSFVPEPSSQFRNLLNSYIESYDAAARDAARMEHGKAFCVALLQHYYPEHEGYIIQASTSGPIVKHGINFMLEAKDGTDSDYMVLPPKIYKKSDKKGPKAQREAEFRRQYRHNKSFIEGVRWYKIEPEEIAGFEVLKKIERAVDDGHTDMEYRMHTYMAIILDHSQTFPLFAATNDVHCGDILADALCRSQQIQSGHAMLLFGSRLEFYDFENGRETEIRCAEDGESFQEAEVNADDPTATICTDAIGNELAVDLRMSDIEVVDHMFKSVAARGVVYIDSRQEHRRDNGEWSAHEE